MSRSGYVDYLANYILNLYRGRVARAMKGKRGQAFLRELLKQLDEMPEKLLIAGELVNETGDCCTIGVVCKAPSLRHGTASTAKGRGIRTIGCGWWSSERWKSDGRTNVDRVD